jgi:hypothetical protein
MPPRLTVSLLVSEGVQGAWVHCLNARCRNYAYLTWRAMRAGLSEQVEDLPYRRRLRCSLCGGREVAIRPYWTKPPTY